MAFKIKELPHGAGTERTSKGLKIQQDFKFMIPIHIAEIAITRPVQISNYSPHGRALTLYVSSILMQKLIATVCINTY